MAGILSLDWLVSKGFAVRIRQVTAGKQDRKLGVDQQPEVVKIKCGVCNKMWSPKVFNDPEDEPLTQHYLMVHPAGVRELLAAAHPQFSQQVTSNNLPNRTGNSTL